MTFQEAVAELRQHHLKIWLRCESMSGDSPEQDPGGWKGAVIVSASGAILAIQTGHCCEWRLTVLHRRPSDTRGQEDMDGDWLITEQFVTDFRGWHVFEPGEHE